MGKANKERPFVKGEEYLEGRRAGVDGTYGAGRNGLGAEKTIWPGADNSNGGGEDSLPNAARSIYQRAVGPSEDPSKQGDQALRDR